MGVFEFGILGPLEVRHQGELVPVPGSRERVVLAVLLLEAGRVVPVSKLVEAIWDGDPPAAAEKAVRNAVSTLRRRFADAGDAGDAGDQASLIETSPAGYLARLDGHQLDAAEFRERTAAARAMKSDGRAGEAAVEFRAALGLWRGAALAGLGGVVIEPSAAQLEEQRLAATEDCLELELQLGRHRELIGELRSLAAEWPLRERLAGLLMLALYQSGRQAEALDAYHRLASRLADELGLDPSAEITALHEAILRQDRSLDVAALHDGLVTPPSRLGSADTEPPAMGPQPPPPRRRPRGKLNRWQAALASACAIAIAAAGTYWLWPTKSTAARDNTDPYIDGCKADEKSLDWAPVYWPGGKTYGTLILRYSAACEAAWGYLNGPNSTAWTIHIVTIRPSDHVSVSWQLSANTALGSWDNVLSTRTGCVYVEAWVTTKTGTGPRATSSCFTDRSS